MDSVRPQRLGCNDRGDGRVDPSTQAEYDGFEAAFQGIVTQAQDQRGVQFLRFGLGDRLDFRAVHVHDADTFLERGKLG